MLYLVSLNQVSDTNPTNNLHWYAVYTKAKEEERAGENLQSWGVETFVPKVQEQRINEFSRRRTNLLKHLFPRYIFAHFDADNMLHKVNLTRGVCKVVSFGDSPSLVEDVLIDTIKSQIGPDGFIKPHDEFSSGDSVTIKSGVFEKLKGTVEQDLNDQLMILLSSASYQGRLMIEKALVKKLEQSRN